MAVHPAIEFIKSVESDAILRRKVARFAAGDVDGLLALARAAGYVVSAADHAAFAELLGKLNGALSETELDAVAGGVLNRQADADAPIGTFKSVAGLKFDTDVVDYSTSPDRKLSP